MFFLVGFKACTLPKIIEHYIWKEAKINLGKL